MLTEFCCLHDSMVLLLACFHGSAACMLPRFCCLHASMILFCRCFHRSNLSLFDWLAFVLAFASWSHLPLAKIKKRIKCIKDLIFLPAVIDQYTFSSCTLSSLYKDHRIFSWPCNYNELLHIHGCKQPWHCKHLPPKFSIITSCSMTTDAGLFTLLTSTVALICAVTLLLSVAILLPCVATALVQYLAC